MEHIPLTMCRDSLTELPTDRLPVDYGLRYFSDGDEELWARIETAAGEFSTTEKALSRFHEEFGGHEGELAERCLFLVGPAGEDVGTAMGWFGSGPGERAPAGAPPTPQSAPAPPHPPHPAHPAHPARSAPAAGAASRAASWGRIHWVGIDPAWQGRGLSKPLVAAALRILAARHDRAYLTTQTTSVAAVKVYLDYGFVPCDVGDAQRRGWRLMAETLHHPALAGW